jgi:hypothetical protein
MVELQDLYPSNRVRLFISSKGTIEKLQGIELKKSIQASEGRCVLSEIVTTAPPLVYGVSNAELAVAFGADMILLNLYDVYNPIIPGAPEWVKYPKDVFELTGVIVGVNLEPVSEERANKLGVAKGRLAIPENALELIKKGAKFIVITGNPEIGISTKDITKAIKEIKDIVNEKALIFAGKVNASGISESIVSHEILLSYVENGADGVLIPAPGSVPNVEMSEVTKIVKTLHDKESLVICSLDNSLEGADVETIRLFAYYGKLIGADIHHIGDAGYYPGIAPPENILCYSITVKGRRHTYRRMAMSILR